MQKTIKDKKTFLEGKGISVGQIEGDDFSTIFHIPAGEVEKANKEKLNWESELNCYVEVSDMFGMNVIIIENKE